MAEQMMWMLKGKIWT